MRKTNRILEDRGSYLVLDVSTRTQPGIKMLIDKLDYNLIRENHKGRMNANLSSGKFRKFYARMKINDNQGVKVHRLILCAEKGSVHHINGNTLDNRRSNLVLCKEETKTKQEAAKLERVKIKQNRVKVKLCKVNVKRIKNKILSDRGGVLEIDVSTKKFPNKIMLIDKFEYTKLRKKYPGKISVSGYYDKDLYPMITIKTKKTKLHRIILGIKDESIYADHINHNRLDNRSCNLRSCTVIENAHNSSLHRKNKSGFIGVSLDGNKKWKAFMTINGEQVLQACFDEKIDAVIARLKAEIKHYGDFMPERNKRAAKEYGLL